MGCGIVSELRKNDGDDVSHSVGGVIVSKMFTRINDGDDVSYNVGCVIVSKMIMKIMVMMSATVVWAVSLSAN